MLELEPSAFTRLMPGKLYDHHCLLLLCSDYKKQSSACTNIFLYILHAQKYIFVHVIKYLLLLYSYGRRRLLSFCVVHIKNKSILRQDEKLILK